MANHIFISYSRKDRTYARKLAEHLRGEGFEVWLDDHIDYGAEWPQAIRQAVRSCAAFVVVMTPDSEQSFWVGCEVHEARNRRKPIFPLLRAGEVFFLLNTTQYVDVTDGRMPGPDLTERMERGGVPRRRPAPAMPPQVRARRAWVWPVGALLVLLLVAGGTLLVQWLGGRPPAAPPTATTDIAPSSAMTLTPEPTLVPTATATSRSL